MRKKSFSDFQKAYKDKKVLLTGHTGFKGGWLNVWLKLLGARVTGLALPPDTSPALFTELNLSNSCTHIEGDIRNQSLLLNIIKELQPDLIFHLAAQSIVRTSYEKPHETIETNILGTANLLESLRVNKHPCQVVIITSDKCYENREWSYSYRENDPMGGYDPYSMSKGAAELVVSSYRRSFFNPNKLKVHGIALASARAGNVIGGGDWAKDRIVPDTIRALRDKQNILIRNPRAIRPWQHVLEPLSGYLTLGTCLGDFKAAEPSTFCDGWNFGPLLEKASPVSRLVEKIIAHWGEGNWAHTNDTLAEHEANDLRLNIDKACTQLGWTPRWNFDTAIQKTVEWYRFHAKNPSSSQLRKFTEQQIVDYMDS